MKSSNDIYHGDEHITDKPEKFIVRMSEVVTYEVEVEAMDEEEAEDLAICKLSVDSIALVGIKNDNGIYVIDQTGFQTDKIERVQKPQNYNYSYGGTDD